MGRDEEAGGLEGWGGMRSYRGGVREDEEGYRDEEEGRDAGGEKGLNPLRIRHISWSLRGLSKQLKEEQSFVCTSSCRSCLQLTVHCLSSSILYCGAKPKHVLD